MSHVPPIVTTYEALCVIYYNFIENIDPYITQLWDIINDGLLTPLHDFLQDGGILQFEGSSGGHEESDLGDGSGKQNIRLKTCGR